MQTPTNILDFEIILRKFHRARHSFNLSQISATLISNKLDVSMKTAERWVKHFEVEKKGKKNGRK